MKTKRSVLVPCLLCALGGALTGANAEHLDSVPGIVLFSMGILLNGYSLTMLGIWRRR